MFELNFYQDQDKWKHKLNLVKTIQTELLI